MKDAPIGEPEHSYLQTEDEARDSIGFLTSDEYPVSGVEPAVRAALEVGLG
jgi:hypothetical protein